jgi:hypothetical protein
MLPSILSRELPFTSRDYKVTIRADGPYVSLLTAYGVDITCDSINSLCLFNISERYHNHTLGLLGTNDGEQSNDFRKPTGHLAGSIRDFADSYEVSGNTECLYNNGMTYFYVLHCFKYQALSQKIIQTIMG